jgi:hypothetical protein
MSKGVVLWMREMTEKNYLGGCFSSAGNKTLVDITQS